MKTQHTIDFDTMRINCIQIHQETADLFRVTKHIGEELNLVVKSADELRTHEKTSSWVGMGLFAKELFENDELWNKLPATLSIIACDGSKKLWMREAARAELRDAYLCLGGKNLQL